MTNPSYKEEITSISSRNVFVATQSSDITVTDK